MIKVFSRVVVVCLVSVFAMPVFAADAEALEEMTRLLKMRLGTDEVETPVATGVEGVYQTRFGNKIAYLIEGLFNILGHLFEIYIIIPTQISNLFNGKPDGKSVGAT